MTDSGVEKMEKKLAVENLYAPEEIETLHHVEQALRAHHLYRNEVDYVVKEGEVAHRRRVHRPPHAGPALVGRPPPGGRGEGGREDRGGEPDPRHHLLPELLPHVLEARRHDRHRRHRGGGVREDLQPRRHRRPHEPARTSARTPRTSSTRREGEKFDAICEEIEKRHAKGQPVLVGTVSVAKSEVVSTLLRRRGVPHNVLNAKHHQREAEIVAQAGRKGAVTISTNMAGRGTDIILGGNPEMMAKHEVGARAGRADGGRGGGGLPRAQGGVGAAARAAGRRSCARRPPREHEEVVAARRAPHRRHRAARVAPHRQPAPRPRRPPGRPRLLDLLPVPRGRAHAHLRVRADPGAHEEDGHEGRRGHRAPLAHEGDRGRAEEGRGATTSTSARTSSSTTT